MRLVVISGDLINAYPAQDRAERAAHQAADLMAALAQLDRGIPLLLQPGNHDLGPGASASAVHLYRQRFGDDYLEAWIGGVLFIAVNAQYYMNNVLSLSSEDRSLWETHDHWLTVILGSERVKSAKKVIILSHIPPFVTHFDEAHGWGNWPLAPRDRIVSAASRAGASLWLSGHLHANSQAEAQGITVVTSSSCGSIINWTSPLPTVSGTMSLAGGAIEKLTGRPSVAASESVAGLRVVRVKEHVTLHRWYSLDEVPATLDAAFLPFHHR